MTNREKLLVRALKTGQITWFEYLELYRTIVPLLLVTLLLSACAPQGPSTVESSASLTANQCCLTEACTKFPIYEERPDGEESIHTHSCFTPSDGSQSCYVCHKVDA